MTLHSDIPETVNTLDFMQGGGETGARLQAADWSKSTLGLPADWPGSLKAAVSLMLPSSAQICLFWGPEMVALYNDAYRPAIGDNHPAALGQPAREGWAHLWEMLEPLLQGVRRSGMPFESRDHLFVQNRYGHEEETFFDVSYNPVRGEDGTVAGVFCIVSDQTKRVIDERRLNVLRVLSMRSGFDTPALAARSFIDVLAAGNPTDAPCALVYLRLDDGTLVLAASHGGTPDPALLILPPDEAGPADRQRAALAKVVATGQLESLDRARFVIDPPEAASERAVLLPLQAGLDVAGVLVVVKNHRLQPTKDYRRFSELLAAQLSASLSVARILCDERDRGRALEQQVAAALAEREVAEAQLRQSQKMEAIGKLTGGVAHDFNNLLQVVGGNLHLLSRDVIGNPRAERRVGNALAGVARGAKLSAQLLAFSRRQPLEPKVVRIGRLITGLDDMLRRSLGEGIEVEASMGGGLWNTLIDQAQMENALLNLAINARDAMAGQGRLTIEAVNATLDDNYARRHGEVTPGQYVMVAVTDTGSGMTPEIMEQVFEPFFSTKPEGKGTGLGLSMVYGFVKQSGGHIKLYSEPGHGTTIRIYLPRTLQAEDVVAEVETGPIQGGSETILVAEDNEGVRDIVVSMLVELGYRVLKAKDAASALSVVDSGARIDLLFTDVVMPGEMRGPELAAKARLRIPDLAVLFTSGYTENAIVHGGRLDPGVDLLSKPYGTEALARKLRQVLSARPAAGSTNPIQPGGPDAVVRMRGRAGAGPLRLLLVEDDVSIRDNSVELLSAHDHLVMSEASGEAALARLAWERFDVLITDLGLPGIDGLELARQALERDPVLGIVIATGADWSPPEPSSPLASAVLLRKPYNEVELAAAVREALRATAAP